jgi:predicted transcriptional regulator
VKSGFTWEALDALRAKTEMIQEDAEGLTVREYAARYNMKQATAYGQLERMVSAGKLVRVRTRRRLPDGTLRPVFVYRLPGDSEAADARG